MPETSDVSHSRYYVYVLHCIKDNGFYIGFTKDLKNRLSLHANGEIHSTKSRLPVKLLHYEYFIEEKDAKAREIFLKSGYGRNQLKDILKTTFEKL